MRFFFSDELWWEKNINFCVWEKNLLKNNQTWKIKEEEDDDEEEEE